MRTLLRSALVLSLASLTLAASALTINFDTAVNAPGSYADIPNGYAGFNWSNFAAEDHVGTSGVGYNNGIRSQSYAAFNGAGNAASLTTPNGVASILSFSGYFTSAFDSPNTVVVTGLRGGSTIGIASLAMVASGPRLLSFSFTSPVDTLSLIGNNGAGGAATQFVLDDLTITPVPEPSALAALGLGAAALLRRRRK